jgi:hypothetical protein
MSKGATIYVEHDTHAKLVRLSEATGLPIESIVRNAIAAFRPALPAADPPVPIADVALRPANDGHDADWVVLKCPLCGRSHVHGTLLSDPTEALGERRARCSRKHTYILRWDGHSLENPAAEPAAPARKTKKPIPPDPPSRPARAGGIKYNGTIFADVILQHSTRGDFWIVSTCPFCEGRHTHAVAPDRAPADALGERGAGCSQTKSYVLRWNGKSEIGRAAEPAQANPKRLRAV